MDYKTYADIKVRVQEKIDIEDETFVGENELIRICQEAVDYCEDKIHTLGVSDRYFETVAPLKLVSGKSDYQFPSNIYASKITKIVQNRQNDVYEIKRIQHSKRYLEVAYANQLASRDYLGYIVLNNDPSVKPVIRMVPTPDRTVTTYSKTIATTDDSYVVTVDDASGLAAGQFIDAVGVPKNTLIQSISGLNVTLSAACTATATGIAAEVIDPDVLVYYIRNANKPTADDSIIDIPEFYHFIVQYMIVECLKKDTGNPRLAGEASKLDILEENLISTLSNMIPDEETKIEFDNSFDEEMS